MEQPLDRALGQQYVLMHGHWNPFGGATIDGDYGKDCQMERLVIRDGQAPLPRGTGLYVHTAAKNAQAFYAVVTCVNGVQNTLEISAANATAEPVAEDKAAPQPVLQKEFAPSPFWNYAEKRFHYVRWEAPPCVNVPSQYYNWAVAVPLTPGEKVPLELSLPRDERSYWRTQYRVEPDSVIVTPHDFPLKTWWYGYHEAQGTLKSFRQGVIQNFTERRILSFMDWVAQKWPVDRERIFATGVVRVSGSHYAGGAGAAGSGALHLALRHPDVFNLALAGHGIPDYAGAIADAKRAGQAAAGLEWETLWGKVEWGLKTDTGKNVWDELNLTQIVSDLPAQTGLPLLTSTSGGLLQAHCNFYRALLEKRQAIIANFGVWGGGKLLPLGARCTWPGAIRADVRKNVCLPVFTNGPGTETIKAAPKEASGNLVVSDGTKRFFGDFNLSFRWRTDDAMDEAERCEMTLSSNKGSASDVTLRRLQKFKVQTGKSYRWELRKLDGEKDILQQGEITVGPDELLTVPAVKLTAAGARLVVVPK